MQTNLVGFRCLTKQSTKPTTHQLANDNDELKSHHLLSSSVIGNFFLSFTIVYFHSCKATIPGYTQRCLQRASRADTTRQRTGATRTTATGGTRTAIGDARMTARGGNREHSEGRLEGQCPSRSYVRLPFFFPLILHCFSILGEANDGELKC
jgi:hypothetical protein